MPIHVSWSELMDSIVSGFGHIQGGWALMFFQTPALLFDLFFSMILDGYLQDTHWVSEEKKFNFSYSSHQGKAHESPRLDWNTWHTLSSPPGGESIISIKSQLWDFYPRQKVKPLTGDGLPILKQSFNMDRCPWKLFEDWLFLKI